MIALAVFGATFSTLATVISFFASATIITACAIDSGGMYA
jgi:hypothetical protein